MVGGGGRSHRATDRRSEFSLTHAGFGVGVRRSGAVDVQSADSEHEVRGQPSGNNPSRRSGPARSRGRPNGGGPVGGSDKLSHARGAPAEDHRFSFEVALAFFLWRPSVQEIETLSSRGGLNFSTAAKNGRNFRVFLRKGKEVQSKEGEGEGEEAVFEMTGGRSDSAPTATMEPPSV